MRLRLRVSQIGEVPYDFDHTGPVCNMGRDAACELPCPDKSSSVSWRHARIDLGADGAWVSDLQSSNGTFVNDRRITERVLLKVGDEIRLGKSGPELSQVIKIRMLRARVAQSREASQADHAHGDAHRPSRVLPERRPRRRRPNPPGARAFSWFCSCCSCCLLSWGSPAWSGGKCVRFATWNRRSAS